MPVQFVQYQTNTAATTNYYIPNWQGQTVTNGYYVLDSPTNIVWTNWNQSQTSITVTPTYSSAVWSEWVNYAQPLYTQTYNSYSMPTPEQEAARRARIEEQRRQGEERQRERRAACVRARTLLDGFLSDEQKAELEAKGRFHVVGSKGRRYCIRATGQAGNVDLLRDDGGVQATLCCHPRGYLPDGDAWLMQLIEIRHDEDHFLQTANVHRGHVPVS